MGVGYHLNNARFRLGRIRGKLEGFLDLQEVNAIFAPLESMPDMSSDERAPIEEWDAVFSVFKAIREGLY